MAQIPARAGGDRGANRQTAADRAEETLEGDRRTRAAATEALVPADLAAEDLQREQRRLDELLGVVRAPERVGPRSPRLDRQLVDWIHVAIDDPLVAVVGAAQANDRPAVLPDRR